MLRRTLLLAGWAGLALAAGAGRDARPGDPGMSVDETPAQRDARMAWWREARFGLFIHWGLYALPAGQWGGRSDHGEWIRHSAQIPLEEYDRLAAQFNPVRFDADRWVRAAQQAGAKYLVITSKHHDGFCLFDSQLTDFDIMATPFRRDVLKELAEACRRHGVRLCLYHSIMDWHHPDYLPRRPWESRPAAGADFDRYVTYMKGQLRELVRSYGPLGVLWFDGEWESTWTEERGRDLYAYVRGLQPDIIINNRVGVGREGMQGLTRAGAFGGDFGTPEQEVPATGLPGVDWETCLTMNDHWGYNRQDENWKSGPDLVRTLIDIASKGGNFLLNVGPTAEGEFPPACLERLQEIGRWLERNGEAIYGTRASPCAAPPWGRCTQKPRPDGGTRLYLHVFEPPADGRLVLHGLRNEPRSAALLADPQQRRLAVAREGDAVVVALPEPLPPAPAHVVALDIVGAPEVVQPPRLRSPAEPAGPDTARSGPGSAGRRCPGPR